MRQGAGFISFTSVDGCAGLWLMCTHPPVGVLSSCQSIRTQTNTTKCTRNQQQNQYTENSLKSIKVGTVRNCK
jgi:hypothetical protein